jgi:hypothetical protein
VYSDLLPAVVESFIFTKLLKSEKRLNTGNIVGVLRWNVYFKAVVGRESDVDTVSIG